MIQSRENRSDFGESISSENEVTETAKLHIKRISTTNEYKKLAFHLSLFVNQQAAQNSAGNKPASFTTTGKYIHP